MLSSDGIPRYSKPTGARTPYVILDDARRVVGVLAGRPRHTGPGPDPYEEAVADAVKVICLAREELLFLEGDLLHRRGDFPARMFGVSHGGGQTVSGQRLQGAQN